MGLFQLIFLDTHSRAYGYSSPRRGLTAPFPPSRRAPADPHTFDYPASLKQYAEWFRFYYPQQAIDEDNADKAAEHEAGDGSKPRNGIKSKWEKYKKDFAASQVSNLIRPTSVTIMCHCFGIISPFVLWSRNWDSGWIRSRCIVAADDVWASQEISMVCGKI
jgi:hypothetical protein